ncbi:carbohydrate ABC transporter permease [Nakamurella flavida]|uniref:Carbohydrate ABC transporter permease n=1 Tax=Nakamurella flavida TaxID=363630 RepID=A0A938YRF5_9ACTN|nr:carbohydrate ABC transporter permease [Nakamurella flavida]MBM9478084.1 carbohydrate ABC transporter permease [Nakamurella flavida]MDP9778695.1 raffinose/stachyose/melibiose transport system permease protein [Nakamurella flavida]
MRITRGEALLNYGVLTLFSLMAVVPLIGVVLTSLTPSGQAGGGLRVPDRLAFENFSEAWDIGRFGSYLLSSVIVTVSVVVLTTVLATFAAFAFARMRFPLSNTIFYLMLVGLMLPAEAFVIPLYYNLRSVGLTDSYWALILPQTAQSLAFAVFWLRNQFRQFPDGIVEAARIDGAGDIRVLWRIIVPPSRPAIITMCLLISMWTWNEFLIPLIMVTRESLRTAPLGLAFFQGQHATDFALLSAAGIIVAAPIVLLYVVAQRHFISGMIGGSVKG